ncbi:BLUF domain-containing protein [uncultured Flavobacterium sp.]|uniref:BLUF domain-containing protein n=1 Tax=uncultured Flavobacterium sp. TaxID=165435 RepID=UPI0030C818A8
MEIYQLTYKSKSINEMDQVSLDLILSEATTSNSKLAVTGCLIYFKGSFIQILEGSKVNVLSTYDKIINDNRHHFIDLLWENESEKRFFEKWDMGFFSPESDNEILFVNNYKLLSRFADKSRGATLSFWASVEKILDEKSC